MTARDAELLLRLAAILGAALVILAAAASAIREIARQAGLF